MKKYWIIFIVAMAVCIIGFCTIIFKCFIQKPQPVVMYLNIDSLKETTADLTTTDSIRCRLGVVAIYPCGKQNAVSDHTPWADVYVCTSYTKEDSLSGDTAIILLDVRTNKDLETIKIPDHFSADIKPTEKFKRCRVLIPVSQIDSIKKKRYKFGNVKIKDTWMED